jgi:hypothetical protein
MGMTTKTCTKCGRVLPIEDYHRAKNGCRHGRVAVCKACVKAYADSRKVEKREYDRLYLKRNYARRKKTNRRWCDEHRDRVNAYCRRTPQTIMANNLRGRIRHWALREKVKTDTLPMDLMGCTITKLREHLESKFKPGMTWGNYGKGVGKWCIDHIVPMNEFDLLDEAQQRIVCHYTNLQCLWFDENSNKGHMHNQVGEDFVPWHERKPRKRNLPAITT